MFAPDDIRDQGIGITRADDLRYAIPIRSRIRLNTASAVLTNLEHIRTWSTGRNLDYCCHVATNYDR